MAKVLFKRKTTDEIKDLEVQDGALIYNTDNGKTYMDFGEERIQTGGNADTMIAIGGEEAPTDTDIKLWFPNNTVNTKASEVINSMNGNQTDLAPSVDAVKNYIEKNIVTGGEPIRCGYKIDGKDVYVKRISATFNGSGTENFTCGLGTSGYTPIDFKIKLDNKSGILFNANTPRSQGNEYVSPSQIHSYWQYGDDFVVVSSNGQDRTGSTIIIELYFTYNEEVSK